MSKILITGTSRGLGRSLSNELNQRNYQVIAGARNIKDIEDLTAYKKIALDICDAETIKAVENEDIDILINNGAYNVAGPVEGIPIEEVQKEFETNVIGSLRLIQSVVPGMRKRGKGIIVNISSVSDRFAYPYGGIYSASKAALAMISEALDFELRHFGIKVILVEAGAIKTDMPIKQKRFTLPDYLPLGEQIKMRFEKYLKQNRRMPPDEMAKLIVDAIENPDTELKVTAGKDAEYMIAMHSKLSDSDWGKTPLFKELNW